MSLDHVTNTIVAAPSQSLQAAKTVAMAAGADVQILGDAIEGEASELGAEMAQAALALQANISRPLVMLSGGECTVTHRGEGVGGPNAEFVLSAAHTLAGAPGVHVLACDTDGVDGAAEIAGAYAGPHTLAESVARDDPIDRALERHDSHGFFERVGGQVITGPTLTNVNDFRAVLIT